MTIQIGYEIEFLSKMDYRQLMQALKTDLGLRFDPGRRQQYQYWDLKEDGSVEYEGREEQDFVGHELVSPIMPKDQGLETLKKVFDWMKSSRKHITNDTCGFHVGVSLSDKVLTRNLNRQKLVCFFEEEKILKKFKRTVNEYCSGHRVDIASRIRANSDYDHETRYALTKSGKIIEVVSFLDSDCDCPIYTKNGFFEFSEEKYRSVNLSKLRGNNPYLEFRAIGGRNYHRKYRDISRIIDHYCDIVEIAADPNRMEEKFKKAKVRVMKEIVRMAKSKKYSERLCMVD